ncbi:helix-turn-helix transcriptional regulator [Asticcacaulis machinosus]|uniref:helix-turn-helix transcriptional regulator n=1 Tax=Asticcacaulis machinosus TaxID=2984211 RepID=UPI0034A3E3BB
MSRFGALLAAHRRDKDLTQAELAEKVGLTREMIGLIETGKHGTNFLNIELICSKLEIDYSELFSLNVSNPVVGDPKLQSILLRLVNLPDSDLDWVENVLEVVLTRRQ